MKNVKRILSILLVALLLLGVMPMAAVSAAGTQDDPINANDKWFGYGVDCYLLNPTLEAGDEDGLWYELTAEQDGILHLEHRYKDVDYTITITVNGVTYEGGCADNVLHNAPLMTLPLQVGDVATIHIVTADAAAGTVYASIKIVAGDADDTIKVKSTDIVVCVAAGETVYFQDDTLNAEYATKGLLVEGDVADTVFYAVTKNTESGASSQKAYTDSDADGVIEAKLGGSLGSAGAPPVKPAWAIENNSAVDQSYALTIVSDAHECNYDDDTDTECNTCGAVRDLEPTACQHVYDHDFDADCNACGETREAAMPLEIVGNSVSPEVNGLAWLVEAKVDGMAVNGTTAVYDNATVGGYKLITMGAVVTNLYAELGYVPSLEELDGIGAVNVEAVYLYDTDVADGTATYAIRLINIPDNQKDREVDIMTYVIFEDEAGVRHTLYCNVDHAAYNEFA